jgi:PKHD-type hydroxylase
MFLHVQGLLNKKQLQKATEILSAAKYVEGKRSAGPSAQFVKNNLHIDAEKTVAFGEFQKLISDALWNNEAVNSVSMPAQMTPPIVNRHEPGMYYGFHTDNPIMGTDPVIRSDIAISIFLNDPESYEGGELFVKTDVGDAELKLPMGDALIYPANSLHQVQKVTSGVRLAAVVWVQSMLRDPAHRQILFEMNKACEIIAKKHPGSEEEGLLLKVYGNLIRMWIEP